METKTTETTETNTNTKDIEILVSEREYTDKDTGKKKKFNTYKAVTKTGKLMDCKFRREVTNLPTKNGIITVKIENMNIAKNMKYPVLWIKAIEEFSPYRTLEDYQVIEEF